jgi:hypothetical protein
LLFDVRFDRAAFNRQVWWQRAIGAVTNERHDTVEAADVMPMRDVGVAKSVLVEVVTHRDATHWMGAEMKAAEATDMSASETADVSAAHAADTAATKATTAARKGSTTSRRKADHDSHCDRENFSVHDTVSPFLLIWVCLLRPPGAVPSSMSIYHRPNPAAPRPKEP